MARKSSTKKNKKKQTSTSAKTGSISRRSNKRENTNGAEEDECTETDCDCFLRRGQMFLPPNLLENTQLFEHDQKR